MSSNEDNLKSLEILLDEARKIQHELIQSKELLEKKATDTSKSILTIIGFFIAASSFIFASSSEITSNIGVIGSLGGAILFFVGALICAEYSSNIREYDQRWLSEMIEQIGKSDLSLKKKTEDLISTYNHCQKTIHKMNNAKAEWLKRSKLFLIVGLFIGIFFALSIGLAMT